MKIKNASVVWWDFDPDFYAALKIIRQIFRDATKLKTGKTIEPVMTSGRDGKHMQGSLHYEGKAADFRLPGRSIAKRKKTITLAQYIVDCINEECGYHLEAILEIYKLNFWNSHIHVELDPKTERNTNG